MDINIIIEEIKICYNISKCLSNTDSKCMFGRTHKDFKRMLKKLEKENNYTSKI